MSDPFLGEIRLVGFNFAPVGWAICEGQTLPISSNTALFSLLGTTYGGNGTSTFQLPNLQSRVAVGVGQGTGLSNYVWGEVTGSETVSLTTAQIPQHNHLLNVANTAGTVADPTNAYPAETIPSVNRVTGTALSYTATATGTANVAAISLSGGNQPHTNLQPLLALYYIIALEGIYPSRN